MRCLIRILLPLEKLVRPTRRNDASIYTYIMLPIYNIILLIYIYKYVLRWPKKQVIVYQSISIRVFSSYSDFVPKMMMVINKTDIFVYNELLHDFGELDATRWSIKIIVFKFLHTLANWKYRRNQRRFKRSKYFGM